MLKGLILSIYGTIDHSLHSKAINIQNILTNDDVIILILHDTIYYNQLEITYCLLMYILHNVIFIISAINN